VICYRQNQKQATQQKPEKNCYLRNTMILKPHPMKYLFIARHGKSSWNSENLKDIDRPLKERGIADGYLMGAKLAEFGNAPELIISSQANRALHTATIFARSLNYPMQKLLIDEQLYMASLEYMQKKITILPDGIDAVMLVSHNPTSTELANDFLSTPIDNLPTTGIVKLSFDCESWREVKASKLTEALIEYPKKYK